MGHVFYISLQHLLNTHTHTHTHKCRSIPAFKFAPLNQRLAVLVTISLNNNNNNNSNTPSIPFRVSAAREKVWLFGARLRREGGLRTIPSEFVIEIKVCAIGWFFRVGGVGIPVPISRF